MRGKPWHAGCSHPRRHAAASSQFITPPDCAYAAQEIERQGAAASCKTVFVLKLLEQLHATGHRTLVFSQSRVMLDIIEVRGGGVECGMWDVSSMPRGTAPLS
eukprot:31732-Chlamydomonas_euryale.AAC.1